jgi:hypothetical protein
VYDGLSVGNSTFIHIKAQSSEPPVFFITNPNANVNISDCVFTNISDSHGNPDAGAVSYWMGSSGNGYYNISGNTFYDISTNKSVLVLSGTFSSLLFTYNTFYNVSLTNEGGVFFFFFFLFLFYFFIFYFFDIFTLLLLFFFFFNFYFILFKKKLF